MRHHELADCKNCPLFENGEFLGLNGIPQGGKYDIAIVGGMPNNAERFKGGFFNTMAGDLMRKVFKHYGASPRVYYTNAVLCRPSNKVVPGKAVAACRPRVIDELEKANIAGPVVTLGNEGALSLLGRIGINTLRVGPQKRSQWISNKVIPTVSPYLCFTQESRFPDLVTDIGKIWNAKVKFYEPHYEILSTENQALEYLAKIMYLANTRVDNNKPDLTIDIECILDKEFSFGHPERHEMLCVGLQYETDHPVVITAEALTNDVWNVLSDCLDICSIVAQNGKFDLNGIRPCVGKKRIGFDTMLASYILDERSGIHGLKYMAQEYLGAPAYDDEIKKYIGPEHDFGKVPLPILYKYNAYDVYCTHLLKELFTTRLAESGLQDTFDMLLRFSDLLMDVEWNGISVSKEYLEKIADEFYWSILLKEHELSVLAYEVNKKGYTRGDGINPRSPLQIKKFFADCGIEVDSTDEEHINMILSYKDKLPPKYRDIIIKFCNLLLEHRGDSKLDSTYITGIKQRLHNGKIHSSYLIHGTTTGRLSSRNPNLQNIPRNSPIKKMYVPSSPGLVLAQSDYSQAELRTLSYFAKDQYFRRIFNAGDIDPFDELTPVLYPGKVKERTDPKVWKEMRTMVKTYVYGLSYGRTEFGIARGFGIPVEVARKHMQSFFSVIPEIVSWQKEIKQAVLNGEDLVTPYGRHRRYTLITEENKNNVMNEALAFLPQSTASDMCVNAAIYLNDNVFTENNNYGAKIINLVHDSIMIECDEKQAEEVVKIVEREMIISAEMVVGDYVKFAADSSIGKTWGEL